MSNLLAASAQMGTSLAFHIIFAFLGVGLPLLLCIAERLAFLRKDATWMNKPTEFQITHVLVTGINPLLYLSMEKRC